MNSKRSVCLCILNICNEDVCHYAQLKKQFLYSKGNINSFKHRQFTDICICEDPELLSEELRNDSELSDLYKNSMTLHSW